MKLTEREKAYHDGYEQGRFDEYAERMGYDQAEKVKAKIDKQKNCPYCHGFKRIRDALIYQHSRQILMLESNSLTYTLALPKSRVYEVQQYINYCPMCGRPLNEEDN